jgi:hypothetical protein
MIQHGDLSPGDWIVGRRHVVEKEHKNLYASNIFLSDGNRLAPYLHRRRPKGAVRSC